MQSQIHDGGQLPMIDTWVNPNQGTGDSPPGVGEMFPGLAERRARGTTLSQLIDEMDQAGVIKAVLCANYSNYDSMPWMEEAIDRYPGRFVGSLVVDPTKGMSEVRRIERGVRDSGVRLVRMLALYTQRPYNDAVYYPVYAKCAELGIPVGLNVGIPGPRVPGSSQHPMSLDDVCSFFPELTVIMAHGGDPWAKLCAKLMQHWDNLYYMSSAYAPKRIPQEIIDYANWKGADRIMWASDYPVLDFVRCRSEIEQMAFTDESTRAKFAWKNAAKMFFGQQ